MATTAAFSSLSVPAPDDTMEMSSPANRNLDDDIDIDFDDYQGGVQLTDDEHMLEDTTRPATATDEVMDDDLQLAGADGQVDEEVMHDDTPQVQETGVVQEDDELIDYGEDEELQGDFTEIAHATEEPTAVPDVAVEDFDEEIERPAEEAGVQPPTFLVIEEVNADAALTSEPPVSDDDPAGAQPDEATAQDDFGAVTSVNEQAETYDEEHVIGDETDAFQPQISVNTALDTPTDGPATPTDTGLHPMTIRYGNLQIPLFKSRRQLDGLLKNDNLANMSLADLVADCRKQLAVKRGEIIPDGQEIVLDFNDLGLMLVEDARAAFESSLNDVLEVYLQLHRNDDLQEIAPLSLTLRPQLKFASGLSTFKQAAAAGQGMSAFGLSHVHPEVGSGHEYFEGEGGEWEHDESGDAAEHVPDQNYDESTYVDHEGDNADFEQGYDEEHHTGEDHNQDADHGYYYDETEEGEYYVEDQGEAAEALDGLTAQAANESYDASEDHVTTEEYLHPAGPEDGPEVATANQGHPGSRTSSTTVQGDDGTAGEYSEGDTIDWDDDSLTTDLSENPATDKHDDTTLNTEYETADTKDTGRDQHLGSEDFLHDFPDQEDGQQYADNEKFADGLGQEEQVDHTDSQYYSQQELAEDLDAPGEYDQEHHPGEGEDEQCPPGHEGLFEGEHYHNDADQTHLDQTATEDQQEEEEEFDDTVIIHRPEEGEYQEGDHEQQPADDFGDDLNFDDEDEDEAQGEQLFDNFDELPHAPTSKPSSGGSPLGKRSFDEIDDLDDESAEMPEVKKVRSS